eukprot:jgi/Chlat1/1480/Chrsp12S02020
MGSPLQAAARVGKEDQEEQEEEHHVVLPVNAQRVYYALTWLLEPLLRLGLPRRANGGGDGVGVGVGDDDSHATDTITLWVHGASLGEVTAALPLVKEVAERKELRRRPLRVLLTACDAAAAQTLAGKAASPLNCTSPLASVAACQAPIDTPRAVKAWFDQAEPSALLLVESELWPNTIAEAARRKVPIALINARISPRSAARWCALPGGRDMVKGMLQTITSIIAMDDDEAQRLLLLGAPADRLIRSPGNLKLFPVYKPDSKDHMLASAVEEIHATVIVGRPVWLAASTHAGEEQVAGRVHRALVQQWPDLLTIIAPRHTSRTERIVKDLQRQGLAVCLRAGGHSAAEPADVYIVNTLGELKAFYAACGIAFVGNSLVQGATGHNIVEAAQLGCAVMTGCHLGQFSSLVRTLNGTVPAAIWQVRDGCELASIVAQLLADTQLRDERAKAAQDAAEAASQAVRSVYLDAVHSFLSAHVRARHVT